MANENNVAKLTVVHAALQQKMEELYELRENLEGVRMDTAVAFGEALGVMSKAKALIGREIDDLLAQR